MFMSRHPDYTTYLPLRGCVFTLEGLIGVGKSSLGRSLELTLQNAGHRAQFFPEYCNAELLRQYISNIPAYAYAFQLFMLSKRIEIYREAEKYAASGGVAIIDRSILGDFTFARMQHKAGCISDEEFKVYCSVMRQEIQLTPTINVFLTCSPQVSMERIKLRGLQPEVEGYELAYLQQLSDAYACTLREAKNVNHLFLPWEDNVGMVDGLLPAETSRNVLITILNYMTHMR